MITESEPTATSAELAELRRSVDVGMTRIDGQLALLAHRGEKAEQDLTQLTHRLRTVERGRWPLPSLAALTGLCGLAVTVWQTFGHR
ncbi:hypothetical protein [Streptomyces palmae]|uniref:Uncharacterized protein n=1 Tax=Streptomyces palmae TaxID=1701085 RepID=A0A4Z0HC76_9ACTN|nr:hypothetical protein [Streptomyces palmae]TGB14253.1 hypothetical protein E4099_08585 [Streptomyces palmae]